MPGIALVVKHFVTQVQLSEKKVVVVFNFHFFAHSEILHHCTKIEILHGAKSLISVGPTK